MAPVVSHLRAGSKKFRTTLAVTAQHREMLDQALNLFHLRADIDLDLMRDSQPLPSFSADAIRGLASIFEDQRPDVVLVQGDTTTAFAASLASFYSRTPVGHVEAGLRSYDKYSPFPEEMNRRLITGLADMHFAPTEEARRNLLLACVHADRIFVTGNPVIDALWMIRSEAVSSAVRQFPFLQNGLKTLLVTAHRRENQGKPMESICRAIAAVVAKHSDVQVIWPVHPNPHVKRIVLDLLQDQERVYLTHPLDYCAFTGVLACCHFVLSDSGGVQEEGPALGKPVLVLRDTTERPEGVAANVTKLVGTSTDAIVSEASRLLTDEKSYRQMALQVSPYGDGKASERIVSAICSYFEIEARLSEEALRTADVALS